MVAFLMAVSVLLSSLTQRTDGACPSGSERVGPGCYITDTISFTPKYAETLSWCLTRGGEPFIPNSYGEMVAVGERLQVYLEGFNYYVWMGCTDNTHEGLFECLDGSQITSSSSWWAPHQPTPPTWGGIQEDCVAYLYEDGLHDFPCDISIDIPDGLITLCEVEPLPDPTTIQSTTSQPPPRDYARYKSAFYSTVKDNEGRNLIGHCLTDHVVMKTTPAQTKLRCAARCFQEAGCKSINYRDGVCELNEETRESVGSSFFSPSDGCSYYELNSKEKR